ncbi:hypothetical protein LTR47_009929 [Exophiala xenobiotica]|nr:hypothetical protein LTR47_009929 [Exophiala xenobiotica]KAK5250326.1 hypothetical protein LTS06_004904 [Exophiala xenobiotica]KAK5284251.1 hypothetical protein LTR40_000529 [Exophiala xenobiotica]KAK5345785.1 hypothetical protein LTR61_010486 [Exophiala xenobiotica]KAK5359184.1 hypothetical protein LTR11_010612 [Exophiala xenobiotica]
MKSSCVNRLTCPLFATCIRGRSTPPGIGRLLQRGLGTRSTLKKKNFPQDTLAPVAAGTTVAVVALSWYYYHGTDLVHAEAPAENIPRKIRLSEVHKHGRGSETRWVVRGDKVYDITDWIPNHPGGEVILRAVGGVIDVYWDIFSIHNKQEVYDILEQYYIGDVDQRDLVDGHVPQDSVEDPFQDDPKRHHSLKVHTERPCNAESPVEALDKFTTPLELFYVRNHLWAPKLDEKLHELTIELPNGEEKVYSLEDLRKFPQVDVTATLQCSGNRRKHMTQGSRYANGLQWGIGGLSNGIFQGIRLRDVLTDAGFESEDPENSEIRHVHFQGAEAYGASIPVDKALSQNGDVLLVHQMNGQPLSQDHGFPLRVLVPGHVAARSVKWLKRITLAEDESQSQWQQRDYKCFGPNRNGSDVNWADAPAIQETPVQSAITSVKDLPKGDKKLLQVYGLEEDAIEVKGYAFAGGGRQVIRVDVSPDNGRSWTQAELLKDDAVGSKRWAWKQWQLVVPRRLAGSMFVVKAVDESYNTQPENHEPTYNFRGNLTGGWHRVPYTNPDSY